MDKHIQRTMERKTDSGTDQWPTDLTNNAVPHDKKHSTAEQTGQQVGRLTWRATPVMELEQLLELPMATKGRFQLTK